jgi:predicted CXXCH cytochrome family protein
MAEKLPALVGTRSLVAALLLLSGGVLHGFASAAQAPSCAGCDADPGPVGHPVDFRPYRALPEQFPLDERGLMTCRTCHVAGLGVGAPAACVECHTDAFFDAMPDDGLSLEQRAHLPSYAPFGGLPVDGYSLRCMTCHDEQLAGPARAGARDSHPIGAKYEDRLRYGGYRPASFLPAEVMLPEGRVGCVSCHQAYAARHGALVLPQAGTGLCAACHQL